MNVQVVFCNYHTAPLAVRERLSFSSDRLHEAYARLSDDFPGIEAVILSTCNRVEIYSAHDDPAELPSHKQLSKFFSEFHGVPEVDFHDDLVAETGTDAVLHLFRVATSIDSMVLGESQIVKQVKEAYEQALEHDSCGIITNTLFQRAIHVSGRVRSETALSEGRVSVASVAVGEFGTGIFERFDDKTVLVIGAGEMAEETLRYLKEEGARKIIVVNRSAERGEALAVKWGGELRAWDQLDESLSRADIIVSATGAMHPILDEERFCQVRKITGTKKVFLLDLGTPRDISASVGEIDEDIFLYNIDDLEETCDRNRNRRAKEVQKAEGIISEEAAAFMKEVHHRATGPIVQRLRNQWHDIRQQELQRLFNKMSHLEEADREQIEYAVERIVNKLLHPPLETLREESEAGTPHGLIAALKQLFHIGE